MAKAKFQYDYERLIKALRAAREARKINQASIAELLNLTVASVSRIENDKQRLKPDDLMFLCWFLDIDPRKFLRVGESVKKTAQMFDLRLLQTQEGVA